MGVRDGLEGGPDTDDHGLFATAPGLSSPSPGSEPAALARTVLRRYTALSHFCLVQPKSSQMACLWGPPSGPLRTPHSQVSLLSLGCTRQKRLSGAYRKVVSNMVSCSH